MAILPIRIWPDTILAKPTRLVTTFDDALKQFVTHMFDSMYYNKGIGLAANQVGDQRQILVVDLDSENLRQSDAALAEDLAKMGFNHPFALINPKITSGTGQIVWEEGCLSLPGVLKCIRRKRDITVTAQNSLGQPLELAAHNLLAVVIQHEIDHLQGRVLLDHPEAKMT